MPAIRATIGCNIDILKVTVIDFAPCPLGFCLSQEETDAGRG
jgi:hypothetical protein